MNIAQKGLVTLLKSAVTGEKLELPEGFRLEDACEIIGKQGLVPLAYQGAVNCGICVQNEIMQRLLKSSYAFLIRSERQMQAVDQIFRAFDENGIDYMPLKGCNMKRLYPKPGLRLMGDADILIRMDQYDKIREILQKLGYDEKDESHHELHWQTEELHLELHKCLFAAVEKDFYPYFGDGWRLAVKQEGHRYALSREDTFVYFFTHMAKHYRHSGIGCRHILDLYVYRRAYPQMDEAYIENAMEKIHLLEFYRNIRRLLAAWFAGEAADEKTEFISQYVLNGGSWGDQKTRFFSEAVKQSAGTGKIGHARAGSIFRAIFPPLEKLQYDYRILFKYPYLYPLFWVPRWVKGILCRPRQIKRKMAVLREMTDEKVTDRQLALNYVGLDFCFEED